MKHVLEAGRSKDPHFSICQRLCAEKLRKRRYVSNTATFFASRNYDTPRNLRPTTAITDFHEETYRYNTSGLGDFAMAGTLNTRLFFILQVFLWRVASDTANDYNNSVLIQDTVSDDAASHGQRPPEYSFEDATNHR